MRKKLDFYTQNDYGREVEVAEQEAEDYRSPFRRDYGRIIHSPAFRRLQRKTQLFPGDESDFFRNRLTHSLEVAQIAKSIALRINYILRTELGYDTAGVDTDLIEVAGLAHDIGHPPFGHTGEEALDRCMRNFGGFEGNAQTMRIVAKLEKRQTESVGDLPDFTEFGDGRDLRRGLNLTYRTMAALLKYDRRIPMHRPKAGSLAKGYYESEESLIKEIKQRVLRGSVEVREMKVIEMQIMDLADDIAYSTYDLEDALKAGFASPLDLISQINDREIANAVASKLFKSQEEREYQHSNPSQSDRSAFEDIKTRAAKVLLDVVDVFLRQTSKSAEEDFAKADLKVSFWEALAEEESRPDLLAALASKLQTLSKAVAGNGYVRAAFCSYLIARRMTKIGVKVNESEPALSKVEIPDDVRFEIDVLKHLTYELHIKSPRLRLVESRGHQVVSELFKSFDEDKAGDLLPLDWRQRQKAFSEFLEHEAFRKRLICDYIAGMTDAYALDMYARLKSANPSVLFRPT